MARLSREFVKLETRLLNDYRFFRMDEYIQLIYIKLLGISRANQNKIPKQIDIIRDLLRTNRSEIEVESAINQIKSNFPKFKENKYFYYFDEYELRLNNSVPKSPRMGCVDEEEDKEEDKEEEQDKDKEARSIFLSCWSYPLTTNYLLNLAKELIKEYGAKKVIKAANICAEYGKRSNFKYLKGVLNGMTKAEEIDKIKDREQRAKEIKRQEKEFTPNPETAKIFRDMLDEMDKKKKSVQPDDSDLKKKNEEFRKKVEKGELK